METRDDRIAILERKIDMVLSRLDAILAARPHKDWYTVEDVAKAVKRSAFQVREWLKAGRMIGRKRPVLRGDKAEWEISREELERHLMHGLRPAETRSPAPCVEAIR